ncbi:hypothetical protein Gotri_011266 [Gossypium trilobum]|uniref:RNase H type-1 domain-containing protein n=1 Tax=Gossypium trilobum TaxID=34281 RepID=A0A7J9ET74_9ROSI|nr:hypothetical protein [Gossypium trilobum]
MIENGKKTPVGSIKINVDATIFNGCRGVGAVARDHDAELDAFKEGLKLAERLKIDRLIVESDSAMLVNAIKKRRTDISILGQTWRAVEGSPSAAPSGGGLAADDTSQIDHYEERKRKKFFFGFAWFTVKEEEEEEGLFGELPYRVLRGRVNGVGYLSNERIMPYLEAYRFRSAALICMFDLKYDLISVLVKWWRLETYTFRLSCGECTITLEDVALQLRLPINGFAVKSFSTLFDPKTLCDDLLGHLPDVGDDKLTTLRFSWLKANFKYLLNNATKRDLMCAARASTGYIVSRALSDDKALCRGHRRLPGIVAVLGALQDAILGIS